MRGRTILMLLAPVLLLAACRLSDEQQIGVLKFVASNITGAVDDVRPAAQQAKVVKHPQPCTQTSALISPRAMQHRLQVVHSRMQYAACRVHRAMITVRHMILFESVTVARTCRPRPAPSVRS